MNRRETLKTLMMATSGLIALPSWANGWRATDVATATMSFSATQQELIAATTDTIIPFGNGIGALSVGVDKFLIRLIDNCYEPAIQDNVKVQLEALEKLALTSYGKSFPSCEQKQREELLLKFNVSEVKAEKDFFQLMKSETIRGFNTSREVMMNYLNYKPVPGHYHGCVDVKT
jgi:hypothetical protein